jgi:hypothetical protein
MRRTSIVVGLLIFATVLGLVVVSRPELLDRVGFGGNTATLRRMSKDFLEDVQFKDFTRAARYHSPAEQKTVDIPFLLERIFMLKPELLDVMEYEILFARIDSTGLRGRVKTRIKVKNLVEPSIHDRELMLYYYREQESSPWYMRLESSLRHLSPDKEKIH